MSASVAVHEHALREVLAQVAHSIESVTGIAVERRRTFAAKVTLLPPIALYSHSSIFSYGNAFNIRHNFFDRASRSDKIF